jgi:hypothetical protein
MKYKKIKKFNLNKGLLSLKRFLRCVIDDALVKKSKNIFSGLSGEIRNPVL